MTKTRQQRRAKARGPAKSRRRGSMLFLTAMLVLLLGGSALVVLFRENPPPLTRGASVGEHWHAKYAISLCGKQVSNFPNREGEVHTHGDAFIHIHPHTQAASGNLANLGTWLRTYETSLFEDQNGKRTLTFPDGTTYTDGDKCPADDEAYDIVVTNDGEAVTGDPSLFVPHDGDSVEIRFGPEVEGGETMPNPYAEAKGLPDEGAGGDEPAPEGGPFEGGPFEEAPAPEDDDPS